MLCACFLCLCKMSPSLVVCPIPGRETLLKIRGPSTSEISLMCLPFSLCVGRPSLEHSTWVALGGLSLSQFASSTLVNSVLRTQCQPRIQAQRSRRAPEARHPLAGALAHPTPCLHLLMESHPLTTPHPNKQGKSQLCTLEQLLQLRNAGWLREA